MATENQPFDSATGLTLDQSEVVSDVLRTDLDLSYKASDSSGAFAGASPTAIDTALAGKPGGSVARLQVSDDGSSWTNANGVDMVYDSTLICDGVDDQISIADHANLRPGSAVHTVSAWFQTSTAQLSVIYGKRNSPATNQILLYMTNTVNGSVGGKIAFLFWSHSGARSRSVITTATFNDGNWHNVVAWYNPTDDKVYLQIDGMVVDHTTGALSLVPVVNNTATPMIGNAFGVTLRFTGKIANVRYYNAAYSSTAAIADYYKTGNDALAGSLVAHWKLDGDATDATGNGHNGTAAGSPAYDAFALPWGEALGNDLALDFDGLNDSAGTVNVGNIRTVEFWIKADDTTTRDVIDLNGTAKITLNGSSQITAAGFTSPTYYLDGVSGGRTITLGKWHHVAITDTADIAASAFRVGYAGTNYFDGCIGQVSVYAAAESGASIAARAEGSAVTVSANTLGHWPLAGADGTDLSPSGLDLTISGAATKTDIHAPGGGEVDSFDLSALALSTLEWRVLLDSRSNDRTAAVDLLTMTYTASGNRRRRLLIGA